MRVAVARLWRTHRMLVVAFLASVALTLFLAGRAVMFSVYWSDPANRDQDIAGWMTPRYIAHSWQVPPEIIAESLGLDRDGSGRRVTLEDIAAERGISVDSLERAVAAAIVRHRAGQ